MRRTLIAFALVLVSYAGNALAQPQYVMTDLGTLGGDTSDPRINAVISFLFDPLR